MWEASPKQEYAARTIRSKITKQLDEFLTPFPPVTKHQVKAKKAAKEVDWDGLYKSLEVDDKVKPVDKFEPGTKLVLISASVLSIKHLLLSGTKAGLQNLEEFVTRRLKLYNDKRNDPNEKALSDISPWAHFGQISVQRCALYVKKHANKYREARDAFIEEAVIRRELADNFCYYQV